MSMISEQVKRLRKLANQWKHNDVAGCNLIFEAADTIEALSAKVRATDRPTEWIPVSERLPKEDEFVLVTFGWFRSEDDLAVNIDHISNGEWMLSELVTAWMPLPEPYREDGE